MEQPGNETSAHRQRRGPRCLIPTATIEAPKMAVQGMSGRAYHFIDGTWSNQMPLKGKNAANDPALAPRGAPLYQTTYGNVAPGLGPHPQDSACFAIWITVTRSHQKVW